MSQEKKIPIQRLNKFFSSKEYNLQVEMAREAFEGFNNLSLILYRVDRKHTPSDDIYNEASRDSIRYLPPIEIPIANYTIDEAENKAYNQGNGTLRYLQNGRLTFKVFSATLAELKTEINFGDYIGLPVNETTILYYSVVNDGVKNFDNTHTLMGYKSFYRTIICAAVDGNEFNGK